jgi:uncharacterized protein (DUF4213/DUF364 family)
MIKIDKKQNKVWARRMHTSLKCYKENLILLYIFEKRVNEQQQEVRQSQEAVANTLGAIDMNAKSKNNHDDNDCELIDLDDFSKPSKKLNNINTLSSISITPIQKTVPKNILNEKSIHLLNKLKGNCLFLKFK